MSEHYLRVEISNFRAIGHADIILDGITVIAGENGSGKSTLSKLLYHTFKVSNEYDKIVLNSFRGRLMSISSNLTKLLSDYNYTYSEVKDISNEIKALFYDSLLLTNYDESRKMFIEAVIQTKSQVTKIFENLKDNSKNKQMNQFSDLYKSLNGERSSYIERTKRILADCINLAKKNEILENTTVQELFDKLIKFSDDIFSFTLADIEQRDISLLNNKIDEVFEIDKQIVDFNLYEYGVCVTDKVAGRLLNLHNVENSIYIDTPMAIGNPSGKNTHWEDLNRCLLLTPQNGIHDINNFVSRDIIHGEVYLEKKDLFRNKFIFKREDGSEFNLIDCATGVKSFAILQLLLNNGSLNNKTFLLIDEPEVHLHPQWIIEYARFLVLLNKEFGVKMLIASHNPDMVSALKYISEKEEILNTLNFYIAEKINGSYLYNYKHLGIEIDEIFNSYNKSYEKLDSYAE